MAKYSKEQIIRMVKEENIRFIRMQFTDIFGQLKNVTITASQVEKAVNNEIMLDGSSIEGFTRIQESDQYLYPDLDTFAILPWRQQSGKCARFICDVHNPDTSAACARTRLSAPRGSPAKAEVSGLCTSQIKRAHLPLC